MLHVSLAQAQETVFEEKDGMLDWLFIHACVGSCDKTMASQDQPPPTQPSPPSLLQLLHCAM
jgi:hypothetical protein